MGKRILILDDDADFNNLLTDIFTQADYDVTSERDPESAIGVFEAGDFDLVVTDQKMPGLTGEEFIKKIRALNASIPVIMVSGYLDNDTIRNLIEEGVGGVFLKPLNVFSLLKRTAVLIEESEASQKRASMLKESDTGVESLDYQHSLPFKFEAYPCKAPKSLEFAKKLYSLRNFKANLIMIGETGTDFGAIVNDLRGFDEEGGENFTFINHSDLQVARMLTIVEEIEREGARRITLVIPKTEELDVEHKKVIFQLARREGEFMGIHSNLRYIFCLGEDIDTLYDREELDDDIYMFMGTSEVRVPPLREIRDDIPIMAQAFARQEAALKELDDYPRFDTSAKVLLHERDWPANTQELRSLIRLAFNWLEAGIITREVIEKSLTSQPHASRNSSVRTLRKQLLRHRDEYARAVYTLNHSDVVQSASFLEVSPECLNGLLKSSLID